MTPYRVYIYDFFVLTSVLSRLLSPIIRFGKQKPTILTGTHANLPSTLRQRYCILLTVLETVHFRWKAPIPQRFRHKSAGTFRPRPDSNSGWLLF
jgi:hypothetical protein